MSKSTQARVLIAFTFAAHVLQPNDIVEADDDLIKDFVGNGQADDHPKAVAAGRAEPTSKLIKIEGEKPSAADAKKAKLEAAEQAVKDAEAALAAAEADKKAAAQKVLDDAQAALKKLQ